MSQEDSVLIIGGWNGKDDLSTVAKFENNSWSQIGSLKQARHGHSAISNGKTILVIGGSGK